MECCPCARVDVVYKTTPEFTDPVPIAVPLSKNVTVPVGVNEPLVATVAVNITDAPDIDGLKLAVTVVVVAA